MITLVLVASALSCMIMALFFFIHIGSREIRDPDLGDFAELLEVIDERFIGEFDIDEIKAAAMHAAVESLDDDWSYYLTPAEYAEFLRHANNRYTGIGVDVVIDDDTEGMKVLGVYGDSGADLAGIVIGDIITGVDGQSIAGLSLSEIRDLLRRPLGSSAVLTVLRSDGEYHLITVLYDVVFTNPVTFEMLIGNIGYVKLRNFEESAADRFIDAVNELIEAGAAGFIYDVRNNNGGRVGEVTKILDFLLPEGEIFISVDRSGIENITRSDANFIDLPAVVLVNQHSYSGAEFFAAMLYEYDYAATIGQQTTGKNRMQSTIPLSNGGAVHISTGHYLTKNRISLYDIGGFTPEFIITMTDEESDLFNRNSLEKESDPQFIKALSLLEITIDKRK